MLTCVRVRWDGTESDRLADSHSAASSGDSTADSPLEPAARTRPHGLRPWAKVQPSHCWAAGWRVAAVDSRPFGGTCALRGCDPKKVFVGAAEAVDHARRIKGRGLAAEAPRLEWGALQEFKRSFTDPVPAAREEGFAKKGIATFHASARFVSEDSMLVGGEMLRARHFLIAVGAKPARLGIPGKISAGSVEECRERGGELLSASETAPRT